MSSDLPGSEFLVFLLIALWTIGAGLILAERALEAARPSKLEQAARRGDRDAQAALEERDRLDRFPSIAQIVLVFLSILTSLFLGAQFVPSFGAWIGSMSGLEPWSEWIALGLVTPPIAFAILALAFAIPHRVALDHPERFARRSVRWLRTAEWLLAPFLRLLDGAVNTIAALLRLRDRRGPAVTEDELETLVNVGAQAGVFEPVEVEMIRRVFRLRDRPAEAMMTPRREIVWLDVRESPETIWTRVVETRHARFPVCDGAIDNVLGVVRAKDLLPANPRQPPHELAGRITVPLFIYEGTRGLRLLDVFKRTRQRFAIVLDEYGSVEGVLTHTDLLEAIVGELPDFDEPEEPAIVTRPDDAWIIQGQVDVDDLSAALGSRRLPQGDYHTVAGFVVTRLGHIPVEGDTLDWDGYRFEVLEMAGNRVARLRVSRLGGGADQAGRQ